MASVVVLGGSEETRLLLRGLLRLHRHQVVGEGATVDALARLPLAALAQPLVLVVDANLEEGGWGESMGRVFRDHPHLHGVLLSPSRSPRVDAHAKSVGFSSVVRRPFSMQELMAAVGSAADGPSAPSEGPPSSSGDVSSPDAPRPG